jgi:hypothetical protein
VELSAKNASRELREALQKEFDELQRTEGVHATEKRLCIKHLLDGFTAAPMPRYESSNKILEELAKTYPALISKP